MTRLTDFLTSLYDSFSEAELQALRHGHARLDEIADDPAMPDDAAVPVYHASDAQVTLDVGLVAEETETGMEVFVTEAAETDASELGFTVDLFELLEQEEGDGSAEEPDTDGETPDDGAEPPEETDRGGEEPPIDVVEGIEPEYRTILRSVGIERLSDLLERSPEDVADLIAAEDVEVSAEEAAGWLDDARGLQSILSEHEATLPVELVNGIGPTYGRRLREEGIDDMAALAARSPEEIADIVSTGSVTVSPERTAAWLERATETLAAMEELAGGETASTTVEGAASADASTDDTEDSA